MTLRMTAIAEGMDSSTVFALSAHEGKQDALDSAKDYAGEEVRLVPTGIPEIDQIEGTELAYLITENASSGAINELMQMLSDMFGSLPSVVIDSVLAPLESQPDIITRPAWATLKDYLYTQGEVGPDEQ